MQMMVEFLKTFDRISCGKTNGREILKDFQSEFQSEKQTAMENSTPVELTFDQNSSQRSWRPWNSYRLSIGIPVGKAYDREISLCAQITTLCEYNSNM